MLKFILSLVDLIQQSNTIQTNNKQSIASRLTDRNLQTCSEGELEDSPQMSLLLSAHHIIHTVIVQTGISFGCKYIIVYHRIFL